MTAIDRTAYPRPGARLTREELGARYALSETDLAFIRVSARGEMGRLMLAALLKARQDLGCFPTPDEIHADTVAYMASQLGLTAPVLARSGDTKPNRSIDIRRRFGHTFPSRRMARRLSSWLPEPPSRPPRP